RTEIVYGVCKRSLKSLLKMHALCLHRRSCRAGSPDRVPGQKNMDQLVAEQLESPGGSDGHTRIRPIIRPCFKNQVVAAISACSSCVSGSVLSRIHDGVEMFEIFVIQIAVRRQLARIRMGL